MEEIIGKVPVKIKQTDDTIYMKFSDGSSCLWYHEQDCCESVWVEDVCGDWNDLLDTPLLVAEKRYGEDSIEKVENKSYVDESYTWTFYTFRSVKGSVDVRWFGTSNGYYSEEVDFYFEKN